ncbi:hypothetical protein CC78DRAFT_615516 [Lojkania enalia]|uniref:Uncharacterized protein n=1 Tax=Lojkania enalia TaxID=147567 RepID=A0A9P4KC71_9PLEO|nr:hypothetical protein CC78DRAFT_615516 [Didymosphaeria enalia]
MLQKLDALLGGQRRRAQELPPNVQQIIPPSYRTKEGTMNIKETKQPHNRLKLRDIAFKSYSTASVSSILLVRKIVTWSAIRCVRVLESCLTLSEGVFHPPKNVDFMYNQKCRSAHCHNQGLTTFAITMVSLLKTHRRSIECLITTPIFRYLAIRTNAFGQSRNLDGAELSGSQLGSMLIAQTLALTKFFLHSVVPALSHGSTQVGGTISHESTTLLSHGHTGHQTPILRSLMLYTTVPLSALLSASVRLAVVKARTHSRT